MAERRRLARPCAAGLLALAGVAFAGGPAGEDARPFVRFVEEAGGACSARSAKRVLVRSTHPTRTLRVWLDRYHMGSGTGDRSRSDLAPGGEPQPLGCSRTTDGVQEWRIVRAVFVD